MAPAVVLLPGLDGTGRLFAPFVTEAAPALDLVTLAYPTDRILSYEALEEFVLPRLPRERPYALLGESFSGPLALKLAARRPAGLAAVILAASFHRRPAARAMAVLRPLAPAFFRLPLPAHAVRLLLAGPDASDALVAEVQAGTAAVKPAVMAARAAEALRADASDEVRNCPVPLLFLWGRDDRLLRSAIPIEIRALSPRAVIRTLPTPHLVLQRAPRAALAEIRAFLAGAGMG
ncbi:MAG: alpha/beta hydrolase [Deltaproteobacteria bacterium]|nr:alpha/beta hydrolase [Deltaproteobacteria bacterium]